MKLFRITREEEYERVLSNKRIINQGEPRDGRNTFPTSQYSKVFYFFEDLDTTLAHFGHLTRSKQQYVICE